MYVENCAFNYVQRLNKTLMAFVIMQIEYLEAFFVKLDFEKLVRFKLMFKLIIELEHYFGRIFMYVQYLEYNF